MGSSNVRAEMRKLLLESYKPKLAEGTSCAICGTATGPFSFHMAEFSVEGSKYPERGVVMSARGTTEKLEGLMGSFPICIQCAPACPICGLPTATDEAMEFISAIEAGAKGTYIKSGLGFCEHLQWRSLFIGVMRRVFRLGRFSSQRPKIELKLSQTYMPENIPPRKAANVKTDSNLLTPQEMHEFGINIVAEYTEKDGYTVLQIQKDLNLNPQIIAKKDGELFHIIVSTAGYPGKGKLNKDIFNAVRPAALNAGASILFAPVGLINADGKTEDEMARLRRGGAYYVGYNGLEPLLLMHTKQQGTSIHSKKETDLKSASSPTESKEFLTIKLAAANGDIKAKTLLGKMYFKGEGVPQNYTEAVIWLRSAAEAGDMQAQGMLGVAYEDGKGVNQDYTKAREYFRKAAEQGSDVAAFFLGKFCLEGKGGEKDPKEAETWLLKSANAGNRGAQGVLAALYLQQNDEEAYFWALIAGKSKHALAATIIPQIEKSLSEAQKIITRRRAETWKPTLLDNE